MIKSRIYADKAFHNTQNSLMIQNSQKTRNRGKLAQFDEEYLKKKEKKTIVSTIYSVKFKTFTRIRNKAKMFPLSTVFQLNIESLS